MVIVHEIRDDDEEFDSQLIRNDSVDDYTTDEEEFENDFEGEEAGNRYKIASIFSFIPSRIRNRLSIWSQKALSSALSFAKMTGKAAWILTTSVLLIGLPLLYAYDREKSLVDYEKEQQRFAPPTKSD